MAHRKMNRKNIELELYGIHAEMCKVFSHPKRLELINILRENECSVGELAGKLEIAVGNLSQHLTMMKQRQMLIARKEGNNIYYRLANPKLLKAFDFIREILLEQMEHHGELLRRTRKLAR